MTSDETADVLDYWRAVVRQGISALGFSRSTSFGVETVTAEIAQPVKHLAERAALAAIEVHTRISGDLTSREGKVLAALATAIASSPATAQVTAYQAVLNERLWREIESDPPRLLEVLAQARD